MKHEARAIHRIYTYELVRGLPSIFVSMMLSLLILGCEDKFSHCEPIFQIAHHVSDRSKELNRAGDRQEIKSWLQTADTMNRAADKLEALKTENSKLIQYQNQLATVYRIYSQATYNAVKARENKNIEILKSARNDAEKAGKMQRNLVREINAYCLTQE